jgi:hypothetical protein
MHQFRQARVVASKGGEAHTRMSASDIAKSCFANAASALLKSAWEKKERDGRLMSPSRQGSKTTRKDKKTLSRLLFGFFASHRHRRGRRRLAYLVNPPSQPHHRTYPHEKRRHRISCTGQ